MSAGPGLREVMMPYRPDRVVVIGLTTLPAWERAQRLAPRSLDTPGVSADVDAWAAWARRAGAPVEVLQDQAATLSAVKARLADLAVRAGRGEDVWFIWCGRGGVNLGRPVLAAWDSTGPSAALTLDEVCAILGRGAGAAGVRLVIDADHVGRGGFSAHRAVVDSVLPVSAVRVRGVDTLYGASLPESGRSRLKLPGADDWSGGIICGLDDGGLPDDPLSDNQFLCPMVDVPGWDSEIDGSVVGVTWYTDMVRQGPWDLARPGRREVPVVEITSKVFELATRSGGTFQRVGFMRVTYENGEPTQERWHLEGRVWPSVFYLRVIEGPQSDAVQQAWDNEYELAATEVWHAFDTEQAVSAPVAAEGEVLYDITAGSDRAKPTSVGAVVRRAGTVEVLAFFSRRLERFMVPIKGWLRFSQVGAVSGSTWYAEQDG